MRTLALCVSLCLCAPASVLGAPQYADSSPAPRRLRAPFARPSDVGRPINADSVAGITMFRGNATRTFYGRGPVPRDPRILWRYPPGRPMCAPSRVGREVRTWCGSGWTGQPAVVERAGGTEVIFGAFDRQVHFLDAATGRPRRPAFPTGDIIKGSVSVDPDGYPLVYTGSRDDYFRIVALDRARPTELWRLWAYSVPRPMWNDDWDGNAVIVDDYLFVGGENGWFYIVKLNRGYDERGLVRVAPEVQIQLPGFDDELLAAIGDRDVSIESSPALFGYRVYFANGGGLVRGLDITELRQDPSAVRPVFRYWGGDDINATLVADERGMLYVAAEQGRRNRRGEGVGQIYSLDPRREEPLRWSLRLPPGPDRFGDVYATPALYGRLLLLPTHSGRLLAVDRDTGIVRWELPLSRHAWSSPVVVDSTLVVADCDGAIRAFDVRRPEVRPPLLWEFRLPSGACIESTPALWNGRIYVGARDGFFYAIGDR